VRWREKDGRRPRRIFADKALAERLVAEKRSAQAGKKRRPRGAKRPGGATLADYFATGYGPKIGRSRKSKRKVAPSTRESRENVWKHWIEPRLGQVRIRNITPADVEALLKTITHAGLGTDGTYPVDEAGNERKPHHSWTNGLAVEEPSDVVQESVSEIRHILRQGDRYLLELRHQGSLYRSARRPGLLRTTALVASCEPTASVAWEAKKKFDEITEAISQAGDRHPELHEGETPQWWKDMLNYKLEVKNNTLQLVAAKDTRTPRRGRVGDTATARRRWSAWSTATRST
jgi:hypothetical protein